MFKRWKLRRKLNKALKLSGSSNLCRYKFYTKGGQISMSMPIAEDSQQLASILEVIAGHLRDKDAVRLASVDAQL